MTNLNDGAMDLDALEDRFRLRRTDPSGKVEEMMLTDADVLQLATSALNLQGMVLRRRAGAKKDDLVVMPVHQVGIGYNAEKGNIHLKMIDPKGVAVAFSVPMVVAKPFLEGLQRRMGELEEEMKKKKKNEGG